MASPFGLEVTVTRWNGPRVKEKYHEVLARGLGDTAWYMQNAAKAGVAVLTGRLQGSITITAPGEDPFIEQHAEPREQGKSREEARELARHGPVVVGAFTPYARRQEFERGAYLIPAFDAGLARVMEFLRAAEAEYGTVGGGSSLGSDIGGPE